MTKPPFVRLGLASLVLALAAQIADAVVPFPRHVPAAAKTMLFRVRAPSGGATVYLLGSVHLLPESSTLPPAVDSAFAKAGIVAFETSLDSVQMRAPEMLSRAQYQNGATLRSSLSPAGAAKADSILKTYGLTLDRFNQFKPWFVSVVMTQLVLSKANFKAEYGVDMQLNARAKQANKPVVGLEGVDFQLGLFDSISPADQEKMLTEGDPPDSSLKQLMFIKDAWAAGDAAKLDSLLNSEMSHTAGLFATLVTNRNKSWIPKIEQMLKGKSDALVVVGAAHLVGKEGVVELLRAKGYVVEQM
jgi:uncharacterized protein YbaP (TraB family)